MMAWAEDASHGFPLVSRLKDIPAKEFLGIWLESGILAGLECPGS